MAELSTITTNLQTRRCELCGEIYYSDEVKTEITVSVDEGTQGQVYTHICPTCTVTLQNILKNPGVVDENIIKMHNMIEAISDMKSRIKNLFNKICRYHYTIPVMENATDYAECVSKIVDDYCNDIELEWANNTERLVKYDKDLSETKMALNCWRAAAIGAIGLIVGNVIVLVLKLIF